MHAGSTPAARPRVICHMIASLDGRIITGRWPDLGEGWAQYEVTGATFGADAWMCGRVTMEALAARVRHADEVAREAARRPAAAGERPDFVAPGAQPPYAVAIDASGRLVWEANEIGGDHIIAVLGQHVSDAYLDRLRERGVSYLLVGDVADRGHAGAGLDLNAALEKLAALGVRTLLLEGGGRINGAMLRDGLIDEVSLLLAPVADGALGTSSLFDVRDPEHAPRRLALQSVEQRAEGILWLRYKVEG